MPSLIVLAIGGNSLIRDEQHRTVPDQWVLARETCRHIAEIVAAGHQVVVTHGNGPQVGFIVRRSELALHELHPVPLDSCDADTQGAIGYMIQQSLENEFTRRRLAKMAVAVVTQVEVAADSPAFTRPTKPIGSFMDEATAHARAAQEGWTIREDAGRGWRRVVPSPDPLAIVEIEAIRTLVRAGFVVTAVGGGGIPVVRNARGELHGVEAVIDKDLASALLAIALQADQFVISTAVSRIALDFGTPRERPINRMTLDEARRHLADGQFGEGSMAPKVRAIVNYLEAGGRRAIVTRPDDLERAVDGEAGTIVER
ncbi:MAG: carbamate kinase [Acidobacteria bacterium]|jgi:carbamate kinase|nr:carbamate kinase [Acidobacteriota bacterium]